MVVELAVQSEAEVQLSVGESEALGDHGAGLLAARHLRGVLHLKNEINM